MSAPTSTLVLDPSRPCQLAGDLLVLWRPRGRGRDELAFGLLATIDICKNTSCSCTDATLQAQRIDDRAVRVTSDGATLRIEHRASDNRAPKRDGGVLRLDITTGVVRTVDGAELPPYVAPFFEEALPFWVLDALWDAWLVPRRNPELDWKTAALAHWEPDMMLDTSVAYPEGRPDRYVVDGALYELDTGFCVRPNCTCTECRFVLFAVTLEEKTTTLTQVASASLRLASMALESLEGEPRFHEPLRTAFRAWCRRQVPPESRLLELRALTRLRGAELHDALARRPATAATREPGRNAACPCGSGKKYKRCCGM